MGIVLNCHPFPNDLITKLIIQIKSYLWTVSQMLQSKSDDWQWNSTINDKRGQGYNEGLVDVLWALTANARVNSRKSHKKVIHDNRQPARDQNRLPSKHKYKKLQFIREINKEDHIKGLRKKNYRLDTFCILHCRITRRRITTSRQFH
jgi:hypothetical protein